MATTTIEAPVPGVFYLRPSPEEPPFKTQGDAVAAGDTLALVEVMKSFMAVQAESAGTFSGYKLENEASVEMGDAICDIEV